MNIQEGFDIVLVGVGGQGVVLASDILAEVAMKNGYDVKKTDTLGMAQRGGSVVSNVRISTHVDSPVIDRGDANFLLGFEKRETARFASMLRTDGVTIMNDAKQEPVSVTAGGEEYPTDEAIDAEITKYADNLIKVPGTDTAVELGNPKVLNTIMLGAMSFFLPFTKSSWTSVLREKLPEKIAEINVDAFNAGRRDMLDIISRAEPADLAGEEEEDEHGHDHCC
jgi:indolepyruvate ferredoxin oxidoreductase beta subunit